MINLSNVNLLCLNRQNNGETLHKAKVNKLLVSKINFFFNLMAFVLGTSYILVLKKFISVILHFRTIQKEGNFILLNRNPKIGDIFIEMWRF